MLPALLVAMSLPSSSIVDRPPHGVSAHYVGSRAPLQATSLVKLPITAFQPAGWLRRALELQRDGLVGNLGEISIWLTKKNNAWLSPTGKGEYGWEEVPYWLRGYSRVAYVLRDPKMIAETKVWIEGTLKSARPDGDFGPIHNHARGFRDLWAQMLMLQVLQSWFEYSGDERVIPFMTNYFRWQSAIPDERFLKDYWENSRGGDNLASVYWLYDRTGESFLLELATKIDRNTANWRQKDRLPNLHNVNIAECFREPATYWLQSGKAEDLEATYRNFELIRQTFGQVPGGMFGADENARPGHDDPRQATETCGFVEQIGSNGFLTAITGDPRWAANTEDIAFNSLPAALMPDYRSLRYLTAPNQAISDGANHAPGIDNSGPFMLMNPFGSRCCQHNHGSGWVNYLEGSWMATSDNGLAALLYYEGSVAAKVASGDEVTIASKTHYPFEESVRLTIGAAKPVKFPVYLLIPGWAKGATVRAGGQTIRAEPGKYVRIEREWKQGDQVAIKLPMSVRTRVWERMKNSVSVDYGPLTFSLQIEEKYNRIDGRTAAQWDSGWQPTADPSKWPTYEILPASPWNYGLVLKPKFKVVRRAWPADNYPFTLSAAPILLHTTGRQIPTWTFDKTGLVAVLPPSPVGVDTPEQPLSLVPMGAARLRISSFPQAKSAESRDTRSSP
jgi:hypothetical protein